MDITLSIRPLVVSLSNVRFDLTDFGRIVILSLFKEKRAERDNRNICILHINLVITFKRIKIKNKWMNFIVLSLYNCCEGPPQSEMLKKGHEHETFVPLFDR